MFKINVKKKKKKGTDLGFFRAWRWHGFGLFLLALSVALFLINSNDRHESPYVDARDSDASQTEPDEKSRIVSGSGSGLSGEILPQGYNPGVKSHSPNTLAPEEFAAIVSAVKGKNELLRSKALNQIKALALVESNFPALRSGLFALESTDEAFAPIVAALGNVGTPQLQNLLCEIVEARGVDWRTFSAIVPVLGFLEAPTPETIGFISMKSGHPDSDFASTSALALGSIVHTLSHKGSRKGEELLQGYIEKVDSKNPNIEELKDSLAVLGNAGLSTTESILVELIEHPRADVRAEAIMALRFIRTQSAEDALLRRLDLEQDFQAWQRIIDALTHGPVSEKVLKKGMQILSANKKTNPELREKVLDLFLHTETSLLKRRELADWLTEFFHDEEHAAVREKVALTIKDMLTER